MTRLCVNTKHGDIQVECPQCFQMYKRGKQYEGHMRLAHFFGKFECMECGSKADYVVDLVKHINENCHTFDPFVLCPVCKGKVLFKDIQQHYEACVKNRKLYWQEYYHREGKQRKEMLKKMKSEVCPTCGKLVKNLDDHEKIHLRAQGLLVENCYCDKCGKKFNGRMSLYQHMYSQHNEVPFACKICDKKFSSSTEMNWHKNEEHGPKLRCEYC